MTADLRTQIRAAIDTHTRTRRQAFVDAGELETCTGCGGDLDNLTHGCKRCCDRQRRRDRRGDPTYLEYERNRQRASRARRRQAPT